MISADEFREIDEELRKIKELLNSVMDFCPVLKKPIKKFFYGIEVIVYQVPKEIHDQIIIFLSELSSFMLIRWYPFKLQDNIKYIIRSCHQGIDSNYYLYLEPKT